MINFNTPPQVIGAITSINNAVEVVVVGEYESFFFIFTEPQIKLFLAK